MKKRNYIITALISAIIISVIFIAKGIYPFGDNSIIWSDMHEQITALYYHFYDSILGGKSLLIDFNSGGGLNFIGVMAYYILSPITFLILFFPREAIPNVVSIIVALKIVLASVSALYFINKTFKNIPNTYKVMLSLLYAFSSYTLNMYVITPWMDIVYLFPVLLVGLKKLLDLENNKLYTIILIVSLITCFYITFMVLIFIILGSLFYLYIYKKENMKKAIFNLGVSTLIAIVTSSIILIPSILQIVDSARIALDIGVIFRSKFGPLSDKLSFIFSASLMITMIILLLINYKKNKKFLKFFVPISLITLIPLLIEPVNKMLHFGSYVYFSYRYGFVTILVLIIGACYYFDNIKKANNPTTFKKLITAFIAVGGISLSIILIKKYYTRILAAINSLTLTRDKTVFFILLIIFLIYMIIYFVIALFNKNNKKFTIAIFSLVIISNVALLSTLYLGVPAKEEQLKVSYERMNLLYKAKKQQYNDYYYLKENDRSLTRNLGMVTSFNTYSNFTSLTNKINFETMQRLGYDSYWMDTESLAGNLFTDIVLAQKYLISKDVYESDYYNYLNNYGGLNLYALKYDIPYGYIIKSNETLKNSTNSFDASNMIYKSITGSNDIFGVHNILINKNDDNSELKKGTIISQVIKINDKSKSYLEIFSSFENAKKIQEAFNIYVNDEMIFAKYPNNNKTGVIDLGIYSNKEINIKIEVLKNVKIKHISLGSLNLEKLNNFATGYKNITDINIEENKINVAVTGSKDDILFLPLTYLDGYESSHELVRVYDNFIGVKLKDGLNNIEISYIPKGFKIGSLLSIMGIILLFLWIIYPKEIKSKILTNISYVLYLVLNSLIILGIYIIPIIMFVISFLLS